MVKSVPRKLRKPDYADYAVAVMGMLPGWRWVTLDASADGAPKGMIRVDGAVMPVKRSGMPNYKRRERGTEKRIWIVLADFKTWLASLASAEGRCVECWGSGEVVESWNHKSGTKYRPCPLCAVPRIAAEQFDERLVLPKEGNH